MRWRRLGTEMLPEVFPDQLPHHVVDLGGSGVSAGMLGEEWGDLLAARI